MVTLIFYLATVVVRRKYFTILKNLRQEVSDIDLPSYRFGSTRVSQAVLGGSIFTMVEVRKRDNEDSESLMRRFSRRVQQSGVLLQARKVRFYARKKNRRLQREEAQRKAGISAERDRLIKLGELDEFAPMSRRSNRGRRP